MISGTTVRGQVVRLVLPVLALMFVLGILGVIGVYRTSSTVEKLTDDVAPAMSANREYMQLMTDAETGLRGWVIAGKPAALAPYEAAIETLPNAAKGLRRHAAGHPGLSELIDRQEVLAEQWMATYARPRLEAGPGRAGYDEARFDAGKTVFDQLRAVNAQVEQALEADADQAREVARKAYRRAIAAVIVLTVAAAVLAWFLARRLRRRVEAPLSEMERTVHALAQGDAGARAPVDGPREVAAVAAALNRLADESERAQEVEAEARARLLSLDQAKSDFVSNVSHELRTPLTSIKGYLEVLRDEVDPDDTSARTWDIIERNVNRLTVLVEDLLTLANVEARHTTLTEVDLADLLEDVVTDLRIAAANRDITLSLEVPGTVVWVLADKTQLLRAMLNVVSNAVKFCRDGGRVDVGLVTEAGEATVTVRDTGIGIPAADLAQLGSRFFRASNAVRLEIGGTGLGVRMVQAILSRHGGRVHFDSVENEFTLVTMHLPVRGRGEE